MSVGHRVFPVLLAVLAALADARGAHGLAFDALLAAVPFTAVTALVCFGEYLEHHEGTFGGLQSLLWGLALALLVLSCAVRSPATETDTRCRPSAPRRSSRAWGSSGSSSFWPGLPHLRRLSLTPAKP